MNANNCGLSADVSVGISSFKGAFVLSLLTKSDLLSYYAEKLEQ